MSHKLLGLVVLLLVLVLPTANSNHIAPTQDVRAYCLEAANINLGVLELRLTNHSKEGIRSLVLADRGLVGPTERLAILSTSYSDFNQQEVEGLAAEIEDGSYNKVLSGYYIRCVKGETYETVQ